MEGALSAELPRSRVDELDALAARLGRGEACWRMALDEALGVVAARGIHHELGFSSLAAYARERCDVTARWAADSVALARRLEQLPLLRESLLHGSVGWSRAELLARIILRSRQTAAREPCPREVELGWLARASSLTCLELRQVLRGLGEVESEPEPRRTLTLNIPELDFWWFRAAEVIYQRLEGPASRALFFEALLAEAANQLRSEGPSPGEQSELDGRDRWRAHLAEWRLEAEKLCQGVVQARATPESSEQGAWPARVELERWTAEHLDEYVVGLGRTLRERDLELGALAEELRRHEVWRRLGFASEAHYARERLGLGRTALEDKRLMAKRLARLPLVLKAVRRGLVSVTAALLITRVATAKTVAAWVERARQRTLKHLREEVAFVERVLARVPAHAGWPPNPETMQASLALEGEVSSGRALLGPPDPALDERAAELQAYEEGGEEPIRKSGGENAGALGRGGLKLGHVRLKVGLPESTLHLYREVERTFHERGGGGRFLNSVCRHFIEVWAPTLRSNRAFEAIYMRDGYRCTSPVCQRHDVTPHHIRFRSRGGGDEEENLTSLCTWCHLEGVHGGRIQVERRDGRLCWRIGRGPSLVVEGRDRMVA